MREGSSAKRAIGVSATNDDDDDKYSSSVASWFVCVGTLFVCAARFCCIQQHLNWFVILLYDLPTRNPTCEWSGVFRVVVSAVVNGVHDNPSTEQPCGH